MTMIQNYSTYIIFGFFPQWREFKCRNCRFFYHDFDNEKWKVNVPSTIVIVAAWRMYTRSSISVSSILEYKLLIWHLLLFQLYIHWNKYTLICIKISLKTRDKLVYIFILIHKQKKKKNVNRRNNVTFACCTSGTHFGGLLHHKCM